jgi:hypothetical protein
MLGGFQIGDEHVEVQLRRVGRIAPAWRAGQVLVGTDHSLGEHGVERSQLDVLLTRTVRDDPELSVPLIVVDQTTDDFRGVIEQEAHERLPVAAFENDAHHEVTDLPNCAHRPVGTGKLVQPWRPVLDGPRISDITALYRLDPSTRDINKTVRHSRSMTHRSGQPLTCVQRCGAWRSLFWSMARWEVPDRGEDSCRCCVRMATKSLRSR